MTEHSTPRTYASLCLYGEDLDPSGVSHLLGVEPTSSARKGEEIRRGRLATRGFWILSTRDVCDSVETSEHITALRRRLPSPAEIKALGQADLIRVYVYWDLQDSNGGPMLDSSSLTWLSDIGAELHVDLYESSSA